MAEQSNAQDCKSCGRWPSGVQIPLYPPKTLIPFGIQSFIESWKQALPNCDERSEEAMPSGNAPSLPTVKSKIQNSKIKITI